MGNFKLNIMQMDCQCAGVLSHTFAEVSFCPSLIRMVPLQMLDHLKLLLSLITAVAAEEGVFIGVGEIVVAQAGCPPETSVAHIADIWLLLAVLLQVCLEEEAGLKGLPTLLTDERAGLTVAGLFVDTQSISTVGTVFALVTLVWLDPCMFSHVVLQLIHPLALVATFWTKILSLLLVDTHVILEAGRVSTGILTQVALVRLLPSMDADMPCNLLLVLGGVLAVRALVDPGATMALHVVVKD